MTTQIFKDLKPETQLNLLVGDVGGTNVRLQLIRTSLQLQYSKSPVLKPLSTENTSKFHTFQAFIEAYLKDVQEENYPHFAIIGIAGPISNNSTKMANTDWPLVDGNAIGKALKIQPFIFLNDFQAVAYGVLGLGEQDLIQLNIKNPQPQQNQVKTIVGPGTGLGVSRLVPSNYGNNQCEYKVWPCEGGHITYSPSNDLEIEYLIYLRKKLGLGQIIAEKAMAGQAVPLIYLFLKQKLNLKSSIEQDLGSNLFNENQLREFPSSKIFEYGVQKKDELCQKVVEFFLTSYGTVIGDLVCNTIPLGGIYLFGGISIAIANYVLQNPQVNFLQDYIKYRPHLVEIFEQTPIYVIKKDSLGLEGAFEAAQRLLQHNDNNIKL